MYNRIGVDIASGLIAHLKLQFAVTMSLLEKVHREVDITALQLKYRIIAQQTQESHYQPWWSKEVVETWESLKGSKNTFSLWEWP